MGFLGKLFLVLFSLVVLLATLWFLCSLIPQWFIEKYWIYGACLILPIYVSGMIAIHWHAWGDL